MYSAFLDNGIFHYFPEPYCHDGNLSKNTSTNKEICDIIFLFFFSAGKKRLMFSAFWAPILKNIFKKRGDKTAKGNTYQLLKAGRQGERNNAPCRLSFRNHRADSLHTQKH